MVGHPLVNLERWSLGYNMCGEGGEDKLARVTINCCHCWNEVALAGRLSSGTESPVNTLLCIALGSRHSHSSTALSSWQQETVRHKEMEDNVAWWVFCHHPPWCKVCRTRRACLSQMWMELCRKFLVWLSDLEPAYLRQVRWNKVYNRVY